MIINPTDRPNCRFIIQLTMPTMKKNYINETTFVATIF